MSHALISALLTERLGYVRRNLPDRVAEVDARLAALGHEIETASVQPQVETAARKKPTKRKKG
jgi:hypothetical protein